MTTPSDTVNHPLPEAVRTALAELATEIEHLVTRMERLMRHQLTTGQHHNAATPATLRAIGVTRTALTTLDQHSGCYPVTRHVHDRDRYTALINTLELIGSALPPFPDPPVLRACLTTLAALALAWLDAFHHLDDNSADDEDTT